MKALEFKPLDTVYFRSGKDISFGTGRSLFPPPPSVLRGVLRGIFLSENPRFIEAARRGEEEPSLKIKIKGVFVKRGASLLFRLPLDLYHPKESQEQVLKRYILQERKSPSSYPLSHFLLSEEEGEVPWGFLEVGAFRKYLDGEGTLRFIGNEEIFWEEEKIGIRRDFSTRTVEESALFSQVFLRLRENVKFLVWYEGAELPGEGIAKLGADGKPAKFKEGEIEDIPMPRFNRRFKIYLATPSIFKNGWLPSWIGKDYLLEKDGIRARLIAAAVGRPQFFSGWDMSKNEPKRNYRAVPAGSVYYFELLEGSPSLLERVFHGKIISEERAEEGFGLSFVGRA